MTDEEAQLDRIELMLRELTEYIYGKLTIEIEGICARTGGHIEEEQRDTR